jgi:hypothetical protein
MINRLVGLNNNFFVKLPIHGTRVTRLLYHKCVLCAITLTISWFIGRARLVVLGSGWGGFSLFRNLPVRQYQPVVISPRPYFVFTPLLASTSVGTLEPRTALENVRGPKGVEYYEASVSSIGK